MADPAHILVFCEDPVTGKALRTHLASEGLRVTATRTPLEAAWCLADDEVNLFLFCLPDAEWVASAILTEVRDAHPTMPVIGLAGTISSELSQLLERLRIAEVLPVSASWQSTAQAIHEALGSLEPATGGLA